MMGVLILYYCFMVSEYIWLVINTVWRLGLAQFDTASNRQELTHGDNFHTVPITGLAQKVYTAKKWKVIPARSQMGNTFSQLEQFWTS